MSALQFNNFQDFQACLDTSSAEIALHALVQQLSETFQPSLLNWELIRSLDSNLLCQGRLLPLLFWNNTLYCASTDTLSIRQLSNFFQCSVELYAIPEATFQQFIQALNLPAKATGTDASGDPSISHVFEELLARAQKLRASDIHIEPQMDRSVLVRFRIDGLLHDIEQLQSDAFHYSTRLVSKIKVAAELDIAETRVPQDGRITAMIHQEPVDLRVSTLPSLHGEKVVIRLLPHKNPFQELRDLGLEGGALLTYYNWIKKPQGMVLITGQTGSGKTSTLYTTLSHMLQAEKNIVTIEDPIEYQLKGVTQVQVHPKVGLTFANGLRSILRQDPDTILLGEIRDTETAEIAYQSALTGHMVLSTLHTNDAPSAIIRLMDIHVEPYLIASATLGVVAQRLIRRVCAQCAEPYTPGRDLLKTLNLLDGTEEPLFYRAVGCEHCFQTGYYGREGIFEVMPIDEELANLITQKEQLSRIRAHLQARKIQSLFESAVRKVERGITTVDEIYRVVPPSQHIRRSSASGSVFVFVLFLLTIISVLVMNMADLFEGQASLLKLQKKSLAGTYATQAALEAGQAVIQDKFQKGRLYFAGDPYNPSADALTQVPELRSLLHQASRVSLGLAPIESSYQLSLQPASTPQHDGSSEYTYTILGKSTANDEQTSAPQQITGTFQIETGALPLSFFERYTSSGTLPNVSDTLSKGPWYSPQRTAETTSPTLGYYDAQTQPLALEQSLWPEIGDPLAEQQLAPAHPSLYLTPIKAGQGASMPVTADVTRTSPKPSVFNPQEAEWGLTVYGNLDRVSLQAPSSNLQLIELEQILPTSLVKDNNGYQSLRFQKTTLAEDFDTHHIQILAQLWQVTLNSQRTVVQKKLINTTEQTLVDHFSGLIRVQGSVNEILSGNAQGQSTYGRPLTLVAVNDIGLPGSLLRQPGAAAASLGLVSQEGTIRFHALQPLPLKDWDADKETQITLQAALASTRYEAAIENTAVLVQGSVASINGPFPDWLHTQSDPDLYSLKNHPPFYPMLNGNLTVCLVTQPPHDTHWSEVRNP